MHTSRISPSSSSSAIRVKARDPSVEKELNPKGVEIFHFGEPDFLSHVVEVSLSSVLLSDRRPWY
jgi:hypothetical protein